MKTRLLVLALTFLFPQFCWGQIKNENLLVAMPTGYKTAFQVRKGSMIMAEMVPQLESAENWTEMVTTQIFLGLTNATPEGFQANMQKRWLEACMGGRGSTIASG